MRFHVCWGSYHGPHKHDLPLRDLVDLVLAVRAQAYSIEASNPRHEHEWRVWESVKLPDGKILIPGVVGHASDFVDGTLFSTLALGQDVSFDSINTDQGPRAKNVRIA